MSEWQPIKTAPKDGTRFIGGEPNNYARTRIYWWSHPQFRKFGNGWAFEGDKLYNPTHWMPLPPPPKGEK